MKRKLTLDMDGDRCLIHDRFKDVGNHSRDNDHCKEKTQSAVCVFKKDTTCGAGNETLSLLGMADEHPPVLGGDSDWQRTGKGGNKGMHKWLKAYGFNAGLVAVVLVTLLDTSGMIFETGRQLHREGGPEAAVILIFLISGLMLPADMLLSGTRDVAGWTVSMVLIFVVSPLLAAVLGFLPLSTGIRIGLCLVAVMPTTLSSGVVMTVAAGGRMAAALMTTITANALSVLTIPVTLVCLLGPVGIPTSIDLDKSAIMGKIFLLVVVPLLSGMTLGRRWRWGRKISRFKLNGVNQLLVLFVVWMALCPARQTILELPGQLFAVAMVSLIFHGLLLASAFLFCRVCQIGKGRRESVIFMGCQKTLPLSVILHASLFPDHAAALLFCVVHHFLHLFLDGYLVQRMRR